ncbi:hypothetical protein OCV51_10405 [Faecalicatena acetigenes]|uniref:Uncharacterized protein n=1 Tax=Faecalicatena acetigenes TaxID=2981790 RepID=A0ABT2TCU1_9FIRM|nr:hypothetical protein [Faecalicatena acetigenes]MCU6748057.1 hypothetical protein [Faecalicatena acetigenes]SCI23588.1 Uncharacterised protein [uncultured Clostridium sp.]
MAYLRFLNSQKIYKTKVVPSGNIVTLKFDNEKEVSTAGFDLFLDEKCEVNIGDNFYHNFKTIYRNDDTTAEYNGYQLSNDGSVYIDPEPPEPYEPTLQEAVEQKVAEMESEQSVTIQNGVDVQLSNGNTEHFTLTAYDQISLMGLQTQVIQGSENIPWHTSNQDEHCKYYSNTDMALIVSKAMEFVTYHVTYLRDLRIYIRSLKTKEEVASIFYGTIIPEEYQSHPLADLLAANV